MRWRGFWLLLLLAWLALPASADDGDGAGRDYIVEAFVSNDAPYVGEQIEYVFRYYAHIVPDGGLRDRLPDFGGFWQGQIFDASAGRVVTIEGRQYVVGELIVQITPLQAGRLVIEPSALIVPETLFQPQREVETGAVVVDVAALPDGAPDGFDGAVGQFFADARVDRTTLTLGEPLTLRLSVTGVGDLRRLPPPDLGLPEDWRVFLNPPRYTASGVTGVRLGEKRFEWLIVPARTGTLALPAIELVYFDPDLVEYRVTRTPEFTLNVFPGADNLTVLPVPPDAAARDRSALALKPVAGLSPVSPPTTTDSAPWLVWALGPLMVTGALAWRVGRSQWRQRRAAIRRRTALRRALASLRQIPARRQSGALLVGVVLRYLNDRTGAEVGALDAQAVRRTLAGAGVAEDVVDGLAVSVQRADSLRFLPPGMDDDMRGLIDGLAEALKRVDACLD